MKSFRLVAIPVMFLMFQGCIIVDHEDTGCIGSECGVTLGDIEFFWSFEMADGLVTDWCYDADIARMDVSIYDEWGSLEFQALDRPCEDMGAIISNFYPGTYELQLVAICRYGSVTHEGWWYLDVYSGNNDFGDLTLDYLGPCE